MAENPYTSSSTQPKRLQIDNNFAVTTSHTNDTTSNDNFESKNTNFNIGQNHTSILTDEELLQIIKNAPKYKPKRSINKNKAVLHYHQLDGLMAAVYATIEGTDDGAFLFHAVVGVTRKIDFFVRSGIFHSGQYPSKASSTQSKTNTNDEYDTRVLIIFRDKSTYSLNHSDGIRRFMMDMSMWLETHIYTKQIDLQERPNQTKYNFDPTNIKLNPPLRKLDAVVTLSAAIDIIKNKFDFFVNKEEIMQIIPKYFTHPIPEIVYKELIPSRFRYVSVYIKLFVCIYNIYIFLISPP